MAVDEIIGKIAKVKYNSDLMRKCCSVGQFKDHGGAKGNGYDQRLPTEQTYKCSSYLAMMIAQQ